MNETAPASTDTAAEAHSTRGSYVSAGKAFDRDMNYIDDRITRDGRDGWPVEAGRYQIGRASCRERV